MMRTIGVDIFSITQNYYGKKLAMNLGHEMDEADMSRRVLDHEKLAAHYYTDLLGVFMPRGPVHMAMSRGMYEIHERVEPVHDPRAWVKMNQYNSGKKRRRRK